MWYDKPSQRVRLFLKENYLDNTNVAYMFDVRFDSSELFWGFINAAYELRETRSKVAILTKLSKQYDNDDYYMCSVVSDRQLWIRRDNSIV